MLIRVDMRETELFGLFQMNLVGTTHALQSEALPVGDFILSSADGQTDYVRGILRDTTNALARLGRGHCSRPCVR